MINNLLDGLKGIGKFLGFILWIIGYLPYKGGVYLLTIKLTADKKLDMAIAAIKEELQKPEAIVKPVKKRAPRKKKVVETVATEVNN